MHAPLTPAGWGAGAGPVAREGTAAGVGSFAGQAVVVSTAGGYGRAVGGRATRALLVEIAGGRRAVQLRGQVQAGKRAASREQIEEAFQEACLRAGRGCRGQTMGEVYKWLLRTTDSLVDDARDRLKREVLVDHSGRAFQVA